MISFTASHEYDAAEQRDFLLRRAEQELIAAIRSNNPEAARRHDAMAHAYGAMARTMIDRIDQEMSMPVTPLDHGKDAPAIR